MRIGFLNLIRNGEPTMTEVTVTFLDRMQKLMEHDVENLIGAERYERSDERAFETRLGTLDLKIAK